MNSLKKRLCAVILLCVSVLSLSSCFIVINDPSEDTEEVTTEAPVTTVPVTSAPDPEEEGISSDERARRRLNSLLSFDMDGATMILVTADNNVPAPIGSSRRIDKARWTVINEVSERYNVELIITRENSAYMQPKLLDARNSGLYYADIVSILSSDLGSFFVEDLLEDLSALPFISTGAEYYYKGAVEASSVGGATYAVAGEACVNFDVFRCMYVNLNAAEKYGFGDIYSTVDSGAWTYDKLLEYVKLYEYSEDGTFRGTAFSSTFEAAEAVSNLFEGTGVRYVYPENGELVLYSPVGKVEQAVAALRTLCYTGNFGFVITEEDKARYWDEEFDELIEPSQLQLFSDGKGVFCFGTLGDISKVYVAEDTVVPIPVPKLNGEQEAYVTPTGGETMVLALPSDGAYLTESAIITEALNVRSYETLTDAYITNCLHYYIRDEKTMESMRTIISNPYFDLSFNFGGRYGALAQNTAKTVIQAAETGLNVLDVHYWYYFGALGALEEIKNAVK